MKTKLIFLSLLTAGFLQAQNVLCTSNLGGGTDPQFLEISIAGTYFKHLTYAAQTSYYHQYPSSGQTTATLTAGQNYSIYASTSSEAITSMWLDYNNNGIFDADEYVLLANSMNTQNSTAFQIPLTVPAGTLKIRIRSRAYGSSMAATSACSSFGSGETRDYTVNVINNSLSTTDWVKNAGFTYYPNPVKNQLTVQNKELIDYISVSDLSGRQILKEKVNAKQKTIDVSHLMSGNYIIIISAKSEHKSVKIIKE